MIRWTIAEQARIERGQLRRFGEGLPVGISHIVRQHLRHEDVALLQMRLQSRQGPGAARIVVRQRHHRVGVGQLRAVRCLQRASDPSESAA